MQLRRALIFLVLAALLSAAVLMALTGYRGSSNYLSPPGSHSVAGTFLRAGNDPATNFDSCPEARAIGMTSWGGYDSNTGRLTTATFRAPILLNFCMAGYPGEEGVRVYLEDATSLQTLDLKIRSTPGEEWRRVIWRLPPAWRGKAARLIIDDQAATGWIGVTPPRDGDYESTLASFGHAVLLVATMLCEAVLFLLPGLCGALVVRRYVEVDPLRFAAIAILGAALLGYTAFWVYLANVTAGKVFSGIALGGSAIVCAVEMVVRKPRPELFRHLLIAAGAALLVGAFYLSLGRLYRTSEEPLEQAQNRIVWQLPPDNELPYMVAERIYLREPLRTPLVTVWKTSDRPPLQSAISLAQYPLWRLFPSAMHYQLLGVFLQSLWIAALWIFLCAARISPRGITVAMGFCAFSGFFFLHSYYVWPKMLAAAILLLALSFTPLTKLVAGRWARFDVALVAIGAGLAMLSHAGVLLAIPGVAVVLVAARQAPPRRQVLALLLGVALLWTPWALYQKFYDPPGDMLLKLHLAGSDDTEHSFFSVLASAYGHISAADLIQSKLANFRGLFVRQDWSGLLFPTGWRQWLGLYQEGNFFCLFQAVAVANLGLLALVFPGWRGRPDEVRLAARLVVAALISVAVWCLVMYSPESAVIHQGPLLNVMFLFVGAGIAAASRWPRLTWVALAVHAAVAFPLFVFARRYIDGNSTSTVEGTLDAGFALMAIVFGAALVLCGCRIARSTSAKS